MQSCSGRAAVQGRRFAGACWLPRMPATMHAAAASCVPLALLRKYSLALLQQYDAAHVCSSMHSPT